MAAFTGVDLVVFALDVVDVGFFTVAFFAGDFFAVFVGFLTVAGFLAAVFFFAAGFFAGADFFLVVLAIGVGSSGFILR